MKLENMKIILTRAEYIDIICRSNDDTDQYEDVKSQLMNMIYHWGNNLTERQKSWLIHNIYKVFQHAEKYEEYKNKYIFDIYFTDVKTNKKKGV
jgi:hypothetical protein